jgi:hypothetical protein
MHIGDLLNSEEFIMKLRSNLLKRVIAWRTTVLKRGFIIRPTYKYVELMNPKIPAQDGILL